MKEILLGSSYKINKVVSQDMKACVVGSGEVNVFATPMMIALMENCSSQCLKQFLDEGETSVGTMINATHTAPTPVGMKVFINATIIKCDGKKVYFEIVAEDEKEEIGRATHTRFIVNKNKFESKCFNK